MSLEKHTINVSTSIEEETSSSTMVDGTFRTKLDELKGAVAETSHNCQYPNTSGFDKDNAANARKRKFETTSKLQTRNATAITLMNGLESRSLDEEVVRKPSTDAVNLEGVNRQSLLATQNEQTRPTLKQMAFEISYPMKEHFVTALPHKEQDNTQTSTRPQNFLRTSSRDDAAVNGSDREHVVSLSHNEISQNNEQDTHQKQYQKILLNQQQENHPQQMPQPKQPEGWRVKLYRLNIDGTWDDCGTGRIVCLYRTKQQSKKNLNEDEIGDIDQWLYKQTGEATLCVHAEIAGGPEAPNGEQPFEQPPHHVLLRTRILLQHDTYQRQGDNIITWCEPYYSLHHSSSNDGNTTRKNMSNTTNGCIGVDLALSFQDNSGCLDIWRQILQVQERARSLIHEQQQLHLRQESGHSESTTSVEDVAAQAAAEHHASLQQEHEKSLLWNKQQHHIYGRRAIADEMHGIQENDENQVSYIMGHTFNNMITSSAEGAHTRLAENGQHVMHSQHHFMSQQHQQWQLPNIPTLENLEEVADVITSLQPIAQLRENLVAWLINNDCIYIKELLKLFPIAEEAKDVAKLATLATCVKSVLLLNDPSVLEWMVRDSIIFEQVCSCLEYDPDLREKANHRWFIRERAKFRTVLSMDDPELISSIHRSFRISYLRDTLLRPTMDESSLSTLSSLLTFTHNDVIKGVAMSGGNPVDPNKHSPHQNVGNGIQENIDYNQEGSPLKGSYMVRIIRMLGVEIHALTAMNWKKMEAMAVASKLRRKEEIEVYASLVAEKDSVNANGLERYMERNDASAKIETDPWIVIPNKEEAHNATTWKQYLAPQDGSLESRCLRRSGCISFLRELFNMVRLSLQQCDRDDFFTALCTMEIDFGRSFENCYQVGYASSSTAGSSNVNDFREISDNVSQTSQDVEVGSVASTVQSSECRLDLNDKTDQTSIADSNSPALKDLTTLHASSSLLSILGNVLADPKVDISEKSSILEIVSGIAMHDPSLIRHHCIENHRECSKRDNQTEPPLTSGRPEPNEKKHLIYFCPPDDLLAALLFLLASETDAGILLQVSEILRIILDNDIVAEHGGNGPMSPSATMSASLFADDDVDDGYPTEKQINSMQQLHDQHHLNPLTAQQHITEQKQFLTIFYDRYVDWLVAPFHFTCLYPSCLIPDRFFSHPSESPLLQKYVAAVQKCKGIPSDDPFLKDIRYDATRNSFTIELIAFCVRTHSLMKFFLLKSRVVGTILSELRPKPSGTGDRCLKLSALRLLRSILSMKDELYNRHIVQHNLFEPVFETYRTNPVSDNLISSAIVEICHFVHEEKDKMKLVLEHIVTKHLLSTKSIGGIPSLEAVASPYVSTLTNLRKAYEEMSISENLTTKVNERVSSGKSPSNNIDQSSSEYKNRGSSSDGLKINAPALLLAQPERKLSGKAFEDQRKFREADDEESYFDSDDDIAETMETTTAESLYASAGEAREETVPTLSIFSAVERS